VVRGWPVGAGNTDAYRGGSTVAAPRGTAPARRTAIDVPRLQPQDLFNELARYSADQQVAVVLGFEGRLDEGELVESVDELLRLEPVLGCRVARDARHVRFQPAPGDRAPMRTIAVAEAWPAALEAASEPLAPYEGPLLGVTLVRGDDCDALVLRVDHAAADGQGAKRVAYELARVYSQVPSGSVAGASERPNRGAGRLLRRFSPLALVRELRSYRPPRPTWGVPGAGGEPGRRRHEIRTLSAPRLEAARARARARVDGATVNDLALAAFYRAMFETLKTPADAPMAVNVSFDLRRYLDPAEPLPAAMNLSSTETVLLAGRAGEDAGATLERVTALTRALKAGRSGLAAAVTLELAGRLSSLASLERRVVEPMRRGRAAGISYPFLSNFGVLESGRLAFGEAVPTRALMLGPAGHPPFTMLGVSSYGGELALAIGYCEGETDASFMSDLLDSVASGFDLGEDAEKG
jgi:NRPS condensation-like uncharacterized protein